MNSEAKRKLIEQYLNAYNAFDVEGMLATLHSKIKFENISGKEVSASATGLEEFRALAEHAKSLFVSRKQILANYIDCGTKVIAEISFEGVLKADLRNGITSGTKLLLAGKSEFSFYQNKIVEIRDICE